MNILYVVIGGGLGAGIRYIFQLLLGKHNGHTFPYATFTVNLLGCLCIGILASLAFKYKWNEHVNLILITGFLGGFTTFSAFSVEFFSLLNNNHIQTALIYWMSSCIAGPVITGIGYIFMRSF